MCDNDRCDSIADDLELVLAAREGRTAEVFLRFSGSWNHRCLTWPRKEL